MGKGLYRRVLEEASLEKAIDELIDVDLVALSHYVDDLPSSGVPGLVKSIVTMEAARRFFESKRPKQGSANTKAEGLDAAYRGESV